MTGNFIFNGTSSLNYGVAVFPKSVYNSPARSGESVKVPGRNGTLFLDDGCYENGRVEYIAIMHSNFAQNMPLFRQHLNTGGVYCRLEDTFNPTEYRMAMLDGSIVMEETGDDIARFIVAFDCKPQRFLKSGETAISVASGQTKSISNPTSNKALPRITVTGTGTFSINGQQITVTANSGSIVIDSEIEHCHEGALSRNNVVELTGNTFPVLQPGSNAVVVPSGMTLSIVPNWWII